MDLIVQGWLHSQPLGYELIMPVEAQPRSNAAPCSSTSSLAVASISVVSAIVREHSEWMSETEDGWDKGRMRQWVSQWVSETVDEAVDERNGIDQIATDIQRSI